MFVVLDTLAPAETRRFRAPHDAFDDCAHSRAVAAGPAGDGNHANSAKYSPPTTELAGAEPSQTPESVRKPGTSGRLFQERRGQGNCMLDGY